MNSFSSKEGVPARFDLHSHSLYSDGSCSATELIDRARATRLAGLAITDHDSLSQLSRVRAAARLDRFPVLAGVEVSACDTETGRKVHLLGFGLQATPDESGPLEMLCAKTRARRTANTLWQAWTIMRAFRQKGRLGPDGVASIVVPGFTVDDVINRAATSSAVYKQHIMEALCHLPYRDERYQKLYRALFKGDGVAVREVGYPDAVDAVRAIREQGGHAVLAHPGQTDSWGVIPRLVKAGLEGIEVHHPDHELRDVSLARDAAIRYGLFRTGGSDFHGAYGAAPRLGCCTIGTAEAGDAVAKLFETERALS